MTPEIEKRIKAVKVGRVLAAHCLDGKKSQWNHLQISDLFDEVCEKNHPDANVLTIIQGTGTVLREESGREIIYDENSLASYKFVKKDDFIIHLRSFEGGLEVANQDGIVSPAYIILRPKIDVSTAYLYALFHSYQFINQTMVPAVEGARDGRSVKYDVLKKQKIFLPPLPEQKRIAEILSAQDKIIELKEKLIVEKQYQKKYLMKELLDESAKQTFKLNGIVIDKKQWEKKILKDVCNFFDSERKPVKEADRQKGIYPYYGASGVIDYVDSYIFDGSYILLGEDGANIVFRSSPLAFKVSGKVWVNNHAHVLAPKDNNDIDFLVNYLESLNYEKYNTGTAQPKLNQDVVEKIELLMPSLPEQQAIAVVLSSADEEIALLQRDLEQEKLKKKSLMQLLLTGLVRV